MLCGYDTTEAICAELSEENRKLKAEVERLQKENHRFADIGKMYIKKFERKIKDVQFTIGQTWEIQTALKETLKEMEAE